MPLAQESIIAPDAVHARTPLKKSTVAWIGVGVLLLAVAGVILPLINVGEQQAPEPAVQKDLPPQVGRPQTIDAEFKEVERRTAMEQAEEARRQQLEQEGQVAGQGQHPVPAGSVGTQSNPVVPEARRSNSSAAFYDQNAGSSSQPALTSQQEREFEIDSSARTSKSIAFDDGGGVLGHAGQEFSKSAPNTPGVSPTPVGTSSVDTRGQAPSALEALLRAQGAQPSGAPKSADRSWLKELAADSAGGSNKPLRPYGVSSPYTLLQGKVLPAVLMRDINTDLPGELSACLTLDVYDSLSSDHLLMPKGSCLVGQYSSSVRPGQDRVLFAFTRILLPNGLSFDLPAAPGGDLGGAAGVEGSVNNHFFRMFSSSFLVAWLADRGERNAPAGTSIGATGGAKTAAGQVLVDTSRTILERDKLIAPTITVKKGERINVEVTRDMEFPGPYRK
jgi:type IV secretory pathway VirB10-like protein